MAAFDLEDAARQGRSGVIPPKWRLFSVSRASLWLNLMVYSACALFLLGVAGYLFATGAAYVPASGGNTSGQALSPIEGVALAIVGLLLLRVALRLIPPLRWSRQHFFLVTPNGFAQVAGKQVMGLPFTEMSAARREVGFLGAKLVAYRREGKPLTLSIGSIYGARALREMEDALSAGLKADEPPKPKAKKPKKTTR